MANAREIKSRIKSVQDTKKITTAMYLIASTRLRKARQSLDATRPYFTTLQTALSRLIRHMPEVESIYLGTGNYNDDGVMRRGYLVITADKGLAGAYNNNIQKEVLRQIKAMAGPWELYVVGECGRQFFQHHGYQIEETFHYTAQNPTIDRARHIASVLLERYKTGALDEIYIAYTDMENSVTATPRFFKLAPLEKGYFRPMEMDEDGYGESCEFMPDLETLVNRMIPDIIAGYIYSALVDSYCAEQNARMMAMDAANRNAEEMLAELSVSYNRMRQAAITQEITEVAGGARAQKQKQVSRRERV
ncbi:MAG: ATP synthase F1 subunit gamma [Clostridiales bacterium]|nr:ATP synthase F1 subunit gamma [Clostridiales bacterium]MCC8099944.1 ATP synthase F1 subunit gamma [Clostridiales bacterium]